MTLTTLLERHRHLIASTWAARVRTLPGRGYRSRPPAEIEAWAIEALDAVIKSQADGSPQALYDRAVAIGRGRAAQGFEIDEVVDGLLLLHETAVPFIFGSCGGAVAEAVDATLALEASLRVMVADFATLFADEMRRAVRRERERTAVVEERQRLARDLHDSVSQSLYGVGMCAEAAARQIEAGDTGAAVLNLREVRDSAIAALGEMRFLIFDLRPPILHDEGLVPALRARLAAVESRAGVNVELEADDAERWPPAVAEALYGIAREALNNVIKHAHATRVGIRIGRNAEGATLDVEDNGRGFDTRAEGAAGGLGLRGMRERAGRIGATVSVTSRPGGGTRVHVAAPAGSGDASGESSLHPGGSPS